MKYIMDSGNYFIVRGDRAGIVPPRKGNIMAKYKDIADYAETATKSYERRKKHVKEELLLAVEHEDWEDVIILASRCLAFEQTLYEISFAEETVERG